MTSMKNLLFPSFLTLVFALLCITGCVGKHGKLMESAQASYRVNDYEAALRDAVMALKHKPDYEKAQNFALTFFNAAVETRQNKIKSLQASASKFRWDGLVAEYKGLIEINRLVKSLPPLIHKKTKQRITFETSDYSTPLRQASENAAETHYREGIRLAKLGADVETQKRAAKEFRKASEFVLGYKDADHRYEQARSAGVKRMAIFTFEDRSGKAQAYGGLLDTITDDIIMSVINNEDAREFLDIISREEIETIMAEQNLGFFERFDNKTVAGIGQIAGVHELVIGKITRLTYAPARIKSKPISRKRTLRIPTGKYVDKKGRTRTRYTDKKISATFTHYTVESSVTLTGSYQILDAKTAKVNKFEKFTVKHEFSAEWGSYRGDENALETVDKQLIRRGEQEAPLEENMVFDAAEKFSAELSEKLIAYAR